MEGISEKEGKEGIFNYIVLKYNSIKNGEQTYHALWSKPLSCACSSMVSVLVPDSSFLYSCPDFPQLWVIIWELK